MDATFAHAIGSGLATGLVLGAGKLITYLRRKDKLLSALRELREGVHQELGQVRAYVHGELAQVRADFALLRHQVVSRTSDEAPTVPMAKANGHADEGEA